MQMRKDARQVLKNLFRLQADEPRLLFGTRPLGVVVVLGGRDDADTEPEASNSCVVLVSGTGHFNTVFHLIRYMRM